MDHLFSIVREQHEDNIVTESHVNVYQNKAHCVSLSKNKTGSFCIKILYKSKYIYRYSRHFKTIIPNVTLSSTLDILISFSGKISQAPKTLLLFYTIK